MQVPTFNAHHTPPAAGMALPGTWPSCAVEPRAPLHPCASVGTGRRQQGKIGSGTGDSWSIAKIGQDRRYTDQRGRAVACT
jgi:hypothetical protein